MSNKWFTVHVNCTIRGQKYRPGVCYELKDSMQRAVEDMVPKGMATIYADKKYVVSGRVYPGVPAQKQEQDVKRAVSAPTPSSGVGTSCSAPVLMPGNPPDSKGRTKVRRPGRKDFD